MEFISPVITVLAVFFIYFTSRPRDTPSAAPQAHALVRTWIGEDPAGLSVDGWRWKCSCGSEGVAGDATNRASLGTEDNAIQRYKSHAKNFTDANRNVWKELYLKKEAEFAEYRNKCYCKETNNDLILMEHVHNA